MEEDDKLNENNKNNDKASFSLGNIIVLLSAFMFGILS